jgi:hypothetical protein
MGINHYLRTEISSDLLSYLCLTSEEDVSREINPGCIRKDTRQLKDITDCIISCNNPFTAESNSLNNLSTGKAAASATQHFLTNVFDIGGKAMVEFIKNCVADPTTFEKPIKKQKIASFAEEGVSIKRKVNGKLQDIKMQRDMFGRLLMLSLNRKIDMAIVFEYPLTPVPLVFGQTDGTVNQTSKSTLIKSIVGSNSFEEPRRARYQIFCNKYETPKQKKQSIQVKGIDGSNLPPCRSAIYQKIARANRLCSVWNKANSFNSVMFAPERNGWQVKKDDFDENCFTLNWFKFYVCSCVYDLARY